MQDTQEVIYRAATLNEANLLRNLLAGEGIEAQVTNAALQSAAGDLPYGGPIEPRVVVDSRHAEHARAIALEFEQVLLRDRASAVADELPTSVRWFKAGVRVFVYSLVWWIAYVFVDGGTRNTDLHIPARALVIGLFLATTAYLLIRPYWNSADLDDELEESPGEDEDAVAWPTCPSCSRRRHTTCPVCQTAGSNFMPAFDPAGAEADDTAASEHPLVICPTCDEAFRPVYLARCEWCGYRFRDGRELAPAPVYTSPWAEMNVRAWIVLVGILLALGVMVGVFGWVASQV